MSFDLPLGIRWLDILDIAIVAVFLYQIFLWLRGTRAMQLLRGLLVLLIVYLFARFLGLRTINWLLELFATVILVALIIVFQPELRRTLERIGRGRLFTRFGFLTPATKGSWIVRQLSKAMEALSGSKTGALIVIERETGLTEFIESGTRADALASAELLISIFLLKGPLHDGAVIIEGDRIAAAACLLPLSESRLLDKRLGTRHRAAVGLSDQSDALVIIVSERTGIISIAENGYLTRFLTKELLEEKLFEIYKKEPPKFEFFPWVKRVILRRKGA